MTIAIQPGLAPVRPETPPLADCRELAALAGERWVDRVNLCLRAERLHAYRPSADTELLYREAADLRRLAWERFDRAVRLCERAGMDRDAANLLLLAYQDRIEAEPVADWYGVDQAPGLSFTGGNPT